jgi:hypothetical protein
MSTTPASPARALSGAAWARVSILLDLGRVDEATQAALAASAATHWHRCFGAAQSLGGAKVYDAHDLVAGWMWCEPGKQRVLVARSVRTRFGLSRCLYRFADGTLRMPEPGFRRIDLGSWNILDAMDREQAGLEPLGD